MNLAAAALGFLLHAPAQSEEAVLAIKAEVERIHAAGQAICWDEMAPAAVPDEDNAALALGPLLERARSFRTVLQVDDRQYELISRLIEYGTLDADEGAQVRAWLSAHDEELAVLEAASRRKAWSFRERPRLLERAMVTGCIRAACARALLEMAAGEVGRAEAHILQARHLLDSFESSPEYLYLPFWLQGQRAIVRTLGHLSRRSDAGVPSALRESVLHPGEPLRIVRLMLEARRVQLLERTGLVAGCRLVEGTPPELRELSREGLMGLDGGPWIAGRILDDLRWMDAVMRDPEILMEERVGDHPPLPLSEHCEQWLRRWVLEAEELSDSIDDLIESLP